MPQREDRKLNRRDFLKTSLVLSGAAIASGLGYRTINHHLRRDYDTARSEALLGGIQPAETPDELPNIVLIFTDDLGYGDLSTYGSEVISTPNLERMAEEGAHMTNFYAAAPLCSPSRAGLLTGRYPVRTLVTSAVYPKGSPMNVFMDFAGFYSYGVRGIPEDEVLLPEILGRRGYKTALLGKWHLGDKPPHRPNENGFDFFYGAHFSNDMNPYRIYRNEEIEIDAPVDQNLLTQNITREAVKYIKEVQAHPFFLYIAHPMPHEPIHASGDFRGQSAAGLYGDAVEEIDWSVGEVLDTLKDLGLDDKTLVLFTSDNGPWWQGSPGFTRGRKNLPFDGGFRVPFIARWPGVIPAGTVSEEMSMNFDLFSTCLHLAGVSLPEDRVIDGTDILPVLTEGAVSPHDRLYYFSGKKLVGVRYRNWKYMRRHMTDNGGYVTLSQGPFLFDLERDPNESYSLIESEPVMAKKLEDMLERFDAEREANLRGWL
jgi:uncharacterized sulfatase